MNSPLVPSVNGAPFADGGWLNPHGSGSAGRANKHRAARPMGRGENPRGRETRGVSRADFSSWERLLRIFRNWRTFA